MSEDQQLELFDVNPKMKPMYALVSTVELDGFMDPGVYLFNDESEAWKFSAKQVRRLPEKLGLDKSISDERLLFDFLGCFEIGDVYTVLKAWNGYFPNEPT